MPVIGLVGERELENRSLALRIRGSAGQTEMGETEFRQYLEKLQGAMPFEPLGWPALLSKQPHFR